jgi:hypothetical protein
MHEHQRTWDEAAWQRFQRMKDDSMVNDYMAVIDTRIDEIVLNWRMQDTVLDQVMRGSLHKGQSRDNFYVKMRASRIIAERMEHHHRDDDLQHMIESIRSSAFHIPPSAMPTSASARSTPTMTSTLRWCSTTPVPTTPTRSPAAPNGVNTSCASVAAYWPPMTGASVP